LVPEFVLDKTTSVLWDGARRISSYDMNFRLIDSKILAYEYMDMVQAAESGGQPEVGPEEGMEALALAYALLESGVRGGPVNVKDIMDGSISSYQDEIDNQMGI
jgi:hypothetical protein